MADEARDKYHDRILEMLKGLAAINGVGIAGVIALMQGQKPVPHELILSGLSFFFGFTCACIAWVDAVSYVAPAPGRQPDERGWNSGRRLSFASIILGGLGVLLTYVWAAGMLPKL